MSCFLALDLGTSYLKAGLFDADGRLRAVARERVASHEPEPGWVEWPAEALWQAVVRQTRAVLAEGGVGAGEVGALSYSSQTNSFVLLDAAGEALTELILWPDARATAEAEELAAFAASQAFVETTGLPFYAPTFVPAKLLWLQRHRPELWRRTARVCLVSDYLAWRLTGRVVTDLGCSGLTGLLDVRAGGWWPPMLERVGLSAAMLPEPRRVGTLVGPLLPGAAAELGLEPATRLVVGTLDHYAGALAAGNTAPGRPSATIGTVLGVVQTAEAVRPGRGAGVCVGAHALPGRYFEMCFCSVSANVLQWFRDTHYPDLSFGDLDVMGAGAPPGAAGLVAHVAPDTPDGSCSFGGERPQHRVGHYVRAIMEAAAWALRERMVALRGEPAPVACLGGGARSDLWLQIVADVLDRPVERLACEEPTLLGAAMAAAVGVGHLPDWPAAARAWRRVALTFVPGDDAAWYRQEPRREPQA